MKYEIWIYNPDGNGIRDIRRDLEHDEMRGMRDDLVLRNVPFRVIPDKKEEKKSWADDEAGKLMYNSMKSWMKHFFNITDEDLKRHTKVGEDLMGGGP